MPGSQQRLRVEMNYESLAQIRSSAGVRAFLEAKAGMVADACNREARTKGFKVGSIQGRGRRGPTSRRWRASVITTNRWAIRHNAHHQTLVRNLEAAKG